MIPAIRISNDQKRAVFRGVRCRFVAYADQLAFDPRVYRTDRTACDHCVVQDKEAASRGQDRCILGGPDRPGIAYCDKLNRNDRLAGYWKKVKK